VTCHALLLSIGCRSPDIIARVSVFGMDGIAKYASLKSGETLTRSQAD